MNINIGISKMIYKTILKGALTALKDGFKALANNLKGSTCNDLAEIQKDLNEANVICADLQAQVELGQKQLGCDTQSK